MSSNYSLFFHIDPNVEDLPLVNSPHIIVLIVVFYLYSVLKWGPNFMKNRPAYNLKTTIQIYNLSQIYFNIYLVYTGFIDMMKKNYFELRVEPYEYPLSYGYFLLKIYDLLETFIFVFRKKQRQVSFLHVYHHIMVLVFVYFGLRSLPGGHNIIYGFVNTCVHTLMYIYYFLAAYDSKMKWLYKWKKFMTQVQLTQFVVLFIHYAWPLYFGHCCVSQAQCVLNVIQAVIMIYLFGDFYIQNYIKKTK
ncbi:Elongation of very long chain fatty acids protein 1, partial [Pseudolycoriella hygida]